MRSPLPPKVDTGRKLKEERVMIDGFADVSGIPDAGSIPDGNQLAVSDSPGYIALTAMIAAGDAALAADQFLPDGRRLIMVHVGREVSGNPREMHVRVSKRGFEMADREYTDWKIAWWREAIQNSVDAKAHNIHLGAQEIDGHMVVSCDDDGVGMDMDTIDSKFLAIGELGGEGKATGEATGGFGVAKKILCFKWPKWEIYSRDNLVAGQNGYAEGVEQEKRRGTLLRVWMPLQTNEFTRIDHAKEFLSRCHFRNVNFTVNGQSYDGPWLYNGRYTDRELEGDKATAKIYYTKESKRLQAQCYVRLQNGMYMHSIDISNYKITGYVVIELIPKTDPETGKPYSSIHFLTSNRDKITDKKLDEEIHSYLWRVSKKNEEALTPAPKTEAIEFHGAGKLQAEIDRRKLEIKQKQADLLYNTRVETKGDEAALSKESAEAIARQMADAEALNAALLALLLKAKYTGQTHVETAVKQIAGTYWKRDFYIYPDGSVNQFRVPKKFYPDTQTTTIHKLARVWADYCLLVMVTLNCDRPFGVGFIFSTKTAAAYLQKGKNEWLLLNPYLMHKKALAEMGKTFDAEDLDSNPIINPHDDEQLRYVFSMAIHEATHMVDDIHYDDPEFTAALTYNTALCGDLFNRIKGVAQESRSKARAERVVQERKELPAPPLAAVTEKQIGPPVFDTGAIEAVLSEPYNKDCDYCHAEAVKGSLWYPVFEPVFNWIRAAKVLASGEAVFRIGKNDDYWTLLIPSKRIPVIYSSYTTDARNPSKRQIIESSFTRYPALIMAALRTPGMDESGDILHAWMNTPIGTSVGGVIGNLEDFSMVRAVAQGLANKLSDEYEAFTRGQVFDARNAVGCRLMSRILSKFDSDLWSVQEGFYEVMFANALRAFESPYEESVRETERMAATCKHKGLVSELGFPVLDGVGNTLIPDMSQTVGVYEHLAKGHYVFVPEEPHTTADVRTNLILATPRPSFYQMPYGGGSITTALANEASKYRHLILLAQGRMMNVLAADMRVERMQSYASGRVSLSGVQIEYSPQRDTFSFWMDNIEREFREVADHPSHFERFGLSTGEVIGRLRAILDYVRNWMDEQS